MGSPCLFTDFKSLRQQALKMGYFYWLRVKSSNHLHKLSDNKLSNNKLSNDKLSDNNLASELVTNRTF